MKNNNPNVIVAADKSHNHYEVKLVILLEIILIAYMRSSTSRWPNNVTKCYSPVLHREVLQCGDLSLVINMEQVKFEPSVKNIPLGGKKEYAMQSNPQ